MFGALTLVSMRCGRERTIKFTVGSTVGNTVGCTVIRMLRHAVRRAVECAVALTYLVAADAAAVSPICNEFRGISEMWGVSQSIPRLDEPNAHVDALSNIS